MPRFLHVFAVAHNGCGCYRETADLIKTVYDLMPKIHGWCDAKILSFFFQIFIPVNRPHPPAKSNPFFHQLLQSEYSKIIFSLRSHAY